MKIETDTAISDFHDGQLLPMDCIAVCPSSDDDVAYLISQIPQCMAAEVARLAAERAMDIVRTDTKFL